MFTNRFTSRIRSSFYHNQDVLNLLWSICLDDDPIFHKPQYPSSDIFAHVSAHLKELIHNDVGRWVRNNDAILRDSVAQTFRKRRSRCIEPEIQRMEYAADCEEIERCTGSTEKAEKK